MWGEFDPLAYASAEALAQDPERVFRWHQETARLVSTAKPNAAHQALALFEQRHRGSVTILTQNIDSLHQRAGSSRVVEVHGSLRELRCGAEACGAKLPAPAPDLSSSRPLCPKCGAQTRYDVTLFGEAMPLDPLWESKRALRSCELFIAVGTSGVVSPAAEFVREAHYAGAHTVLLNAEAHEKTNHYFLETIIGRAEDRLPELLGVS